VLQIIVLPPKMLVWLCQLNLGIGPFVIGPFVERKIGKSQFTAMSLDTEFRDSNWAKENQYLPSGF
jgi:hypothetical protein